MSHVKQQVYYYHISTNFTRGKFNFTKKFFGLTCSLTLSKNHGGIMLNKGVVSETGFGDGCYSLYVGKNNEGKIVAASIIFITDEELEEY